MPDRELLLERLERLAIVLDELMPQCAELVRDAITLMKEQPESVRCKYCAYAIFKEGLVQPGHIVCTKPFTENWQSVKPNNWFCADGTRKEI